MNKPIYASVKKIQIELKCQYINFITFTQFYYDYMIRKQDKEYLQDFYIDTDSLVVQIQQRNQGCNRGEQSRSPL